MNNKSIHKIEEIRLRRDAVHLFISRMDSSDDVEWITVNGTHIPLKNGEAVGGPTELRNSINKGKSHSSRKAGTGKSGTKKVVSASDVNSSIKSKWGNGDYVSTEKDIDDALARMEDGDSFKMNGFTFEKKGEDEYTSKNDEDGSKDEWSSSEVRGYMKEQYGDYESTPPKFQYLWNKGDEDDPAVTKRRNQKIKNMWEKGGPEYSKTVEKAADIMRDNDSITVGELQIIRRKDGYFYHDPHTGEPKVHKTSADIAKYISGLTSYIDSPPVFKYRKKKDYAGDPWL